GIRGRAGGARAQPLDRRLEPGDVAVELELRVELPARLALDEGLVAEHGPQPVRVVPEKLVATAGRRVRPEAVDDLVGGEPAAVRLEQVEQLAGRGEAPVTGGIARRRRTGRAGEQDDRLAEEPRLDTRRLGR